jgi:hypothetical protein
MCPGGTQQQIPTERTILARRNESLENCLRPNKKRFRRRVGDIICIPLGDSQYGFGRVLEEAVFAFYNLKCDKVPDVSRILSARVIFKVPVMDNSVTSGRWPIVGHAELEPELSVAPKFFMEDVITGRLSIYHQGEITPATPEECDKLEAAAVWEPHQVECRLRDYFAGVPNATYEWLRPGRIPGGPSTKRH